MKVLILSCNTGQGHNSAALAVEEALRLQGAECTVRDALTLSGKNTSKYAENIYVSITTHIPAAFGGIYHLGSFISNSRVKSPVYWANTRYAQILGDYVKNGGFDAVVCSHLFPAEALTCLRRKGLLSVKTYAVATDYTCIPFWEETELDYYFLPHRDLKGEFVKKKIPEKKLLCTGIPVSQRSMHPSSREEARSRLGLPSEKTIFLVMTGSMGFGDISSFTLDLLLNCPMGSLILILTGRNTPLKNRIDHDFSGESRVRTIPFTTDAPLYIDACDVLLTKPGGLTSTEAAVQNAPLVHTRPIPGCETANALFFASHGLSLFERDPKKAAQAAARLAQDTELRRKMKLCQRNEINPRAADDIASFLLEASR